MGRSGMQVVRGPWVLNVCRAENDVIVCMLGVSSAGGHFVGARKYVEVRWGIRPARRQPARTPTARPINTRPYVADHPPRSGVKRSADSGSSGPVGKSRAPVIRVKGSIMPPTGFEHASPDNGYPRKSVALTTKLRGLMC